MKTNNKSTAPHCKLFPHGRVARYDAAAPIGLRPYDRMKLRWIGDGVIHSIDGHKQPGLDRLSFFRVILKGKHKRE